MRWMLYIVSFLYKLLIVGKSFLYKYKILKSYQFEIPIISIGNLTLGGTGKTPMTQWLFKQLILMGKHPCIITRGYNRKSTNLFFVNNNNSNYTVNEIGDEPLMMSKKIKNIQMVVNDNKIKAIEAAINSLDIDLIILDDGFQSLYIDRVFDIVMINGGKNSREYDLFPLGNSREPITNIGRANAVVINKGDSSSFINKICRRKNVDVFKANNMFSCVNHRDEKIKDLSRLNFVVVCGIGDPNFFIEAIKDHNINMKRKMIYKDHYNYTANDMKKIYRVMDDCGCNAILTTWKDYYKLNYFNTKNKRVIILDMKLEFNENSLLQMINVAINEN